MHAYSGEAAWFYSYNHMYIYSLQHIGVSVWDQLPVFQTRILSISLRLSSLAHFRLVLPSCADFYVVICNNCASLPSMPPSVGAMDWLSMPACATGIGFCTHDENSQN